MTYFSKYTKLNCCPCELPDFNENKGHLPHSNAAPFSVKARGYQGVFINEN